MQQVDIRNLLYDCYLWRPQRQCEVTKPLLAVELACNMTVFKKSF